MLGFETLDWIIIAAYFLTLLGVAYWVIRQQQKNSEDYFLAGRNVGWFVIGSSIFASNIGSEHVVGLAGSGASSGVPMAHYELHAWIVLLLGWLFLPFYMRAGVFTMPEFLEKRFDVRSRWFLSIFSIIGYIMTKVSITIYAGGIVVSQLMGVSFLAGAITIVVITGIYTVLGGMRAVVYTESIQTVILIGGAILLTVMGLNEVGGWEALREKAGSEHFNMWRPIDSDFPWTALLIGGTITGIWYWCTDQYIVQRTLAANNIKVGRRGAIFGAYLKILPIFIFILPGIIAFVFKQEGRPGFDFEKADQVYPLLVQELLPVGVKGLIAAGLMAALMSSLASIFNSSSTIFTVDIFKKLYPDTEEKKLVNIGKIATVGIVILGMLWIPIMDKIGRNGVMYEYLQSVSGYIAPPITTVFLLGIFSKRINGQGTIATLMTGLVLGTLRIIAEINRDMFADGTLFHTFATAHFGHFAIFMFLICVVVCIAVSLATPAQSVEQIQGLAYGTLSKEQKSESTKSYNKVDIIISIVLVVIVLSILAYFNG